MAVVGILSGKGGVGKTTITSNLATALSRVYNRKVVVLDTNITSSHIKLHFGMFDELKKNLEDLVRDKKNIDEIAYRSDLCEVDIVPAPEKLKGLDLENLKNLVQKISESVYDFVIIDSAPGFRENTPNVIKASDKVLVITTPQIPDLADCLKMVEVLRKNKKEFIVVVNRVRKKKYELKKKNIMEMLDIDEDEIFYIPEDDKVPESISKGVPVVVYAPGSKAAIALKKLAGFLIGEEYRPKIIDRIKWFLRIE